MMNLRISVIGIALGMAMAACATAPTTPSGRASLEASADQTLQMMRARDPGLNQLLQSSAGYVVFPEIGKGGFIAGAAYGRGILYQNGRQVGFVEMNQGALGALIGGKTFAELIVFQDPFNVNRLKAGTFSLGANASAVALTRGAAAEANFREGVAVFIVPRGGLMAELSVTGQQLNYQDKGG